MKDNKSQLFILALLLFGLVVGVVLVQEQQLFRKEAATDPYGAFEVTDPGGNPLLCDGDTCETNSLEVKIKVRDLERLLEE